MFSEEELKTSEGLSLLNDHLIDVSYINGYVVTVDDYRIFSFLKNTSENTHKQYTHIKRWFDHIKNMPTSTVSK